MSRKLKIHLCCLLILIYSCTGKPPAASLREPAAPVAIDQVKVILPQAGNVELVERYCVACHSLRYIEMQPRLSRKSWEKIVDKMIHVYGAPIHDSVTREDIINYLWAIRRSEQ